MSEIEFSGLVIVAAVAFTAPLLLGLAPALRLPAVVLEQSWHRRPLPPSPAS